MSARSSRAAALASGALLLLLSLLLSGSALASGEGGGGSHFAFEWINLGILAVALFFATRKPVLSYLAERRQRIQDDLGKSQRLLESAEGELNEWSGKAEHLDDEVADIRRLSRERAQAQRSRILADAELAAEAVRRNASGAIDRELQRARKTLSQETADLAVQLAEEQLRSQVTAADHDRLFDEFIALIESGAGANTGRPGVARPGGGVS